MIDPRINSQQQGQHYVPRTYLERFVNSKKKLLVIDLLDKDRYFEPKPANFCIENGINDISFYTQDRGITVPANLVENILYAQGVESQFDIHMRMTLDQSILPSKDASYQAFGVFTIFQSVRTPGFRSLIRGGMEKHFPGIEFGVISSTLGMKMIAEYKYLDNAVFTIFKAAKDRKFITSDL